MKKLVKVALVAIGMLFIGNFAKAQLKIGYIDQNALITAMPELKTVNVTMDAYKKQYIDQQTLLKNEFDQKLAAYNSKRATMTDAQKTTAESELQDLQNRENQLQTTATQAVETKGQELIKPLTDRAHTAIDAVAKERGYAYVLDSSQTALLVSPPADDMLAAVKLKLGIK